MIPHLLSSPIPYPSCLPLVHSSSAAAYSGRYLASWSARSVRPWAARLLLCLNSSVEIAWCFIPFPLESKRVAFPILRAAAAKTFRLCRNKSRILIPLLISTDSRAGEEGSIRSVDHAVVGGVVAVVVFAMLCLLIILGRYFARHKGKAKTETEKWRDLVQLSLLKLAVSTAALGVLRTQAKTEIWKSYYKT